MSTIESAEVFGTSYAIPDGLLHPGDTPGLGVSSDEELAAFDYAPAYLPINRLAGPEHARLVRSCV